MNLKNPNSFSHHSFRRSGATAAYEHGCTAQQTMHFGDWSSLNVMENYIVHTKPTKRKIANAVTGNFVSDGNKRFKLSDENGENSIDQPEDERMEVDEFDLKRSNELSGVSEMMNDLKLKEKRKKMIDILNQMPITNHHGNITINFN